ncbi:sensor histidine kinase [Shewanella surugensis]|uniref:histidine kinase n=1 Tax=Shewanella surugensis TaxID=212020 RepID=A0ABT0LFS4_9GAMM|nr:HAMP domain-containing sensor histidine kinase [Shewanella surugensis]MCL1126562.1 HAMP domain-containing histidine kinase [Shewanella surugensis]
MRIKPSLRLYFFIAILVLGTSLTLVFSALTINYFIEGLDTGMRGTMRQLSQVENVRDGHPVRLINFQISSQWKDVPADIRSQFSQPPTTPGVLQKKLIGITLFSPPKKAYFVIYMMNNQGKGRYVSKVFNKETIKNETKKGSSHFTGIMLFGIGGLIIFTLFLFLIMNKMSSPMESLINWTKTLNDKNLAFPPPDFKYHEPNELAQIIHNSLNSVQESLNREQVFLSYASHELRTPIAVIRSNIELLNKMNDVEPLGDKQQKILQRIERAGFTMTHLTEALLWLGRDNAIPPQLSVIKLNELIVQLVDELSYLLQGKAVNIEIDTHLYHIELPTTACLIVLTNLIRNAFQHTQSGTVSITQKHHHVIIENNNNDPEVDDEALGFGLGLELTQRLIEKFKWPYKTQITSSGHRVEVSFTQTNE